MNYACYYMLHLLPARQPSVWATPFDLPSSTARPAGSRRVVCRNPPPRPSLAPPLPRTRAGQQAAAASRQRAVPAARERARTASALRGRQSAAEKMRCSPGSGRCHCVDVAPGTVDWTAENSDDRCRSLGRFLEHRGNARGLHPCCQSQAGLDMRAVWVTPNAHDLLRPARAGVHRDSGAATVGLGRDSSRSSSSIPASNVVTLRREIREASSALRPIRKCLNSAAL